MDSKIRVGIIGYGYWGPNLARNMMSLPNAQVVRICDLSEQRLAEAHKSFPAVDLSTDRKAVTAAEDIDAVVVATPTHLHHPLAMEAMQNGKHVFVEKPLAATLEQGIEMVEYAEANNLTQMVGHTFVYSAPVRKIKELMSSGDIGKVLNIDGQRLNLGLFQKDINVVWDLAPHDISILLYLLDEEPNAVNCQGKSHFVDGIEDVATMSLFFPSGAFATLHLSWLNPHKTRLINIVGAHKMISYDDTEPLEKIKVYDKRMEPIPYYENMGEFQAAYHYGDIYVPYFKQREPLQVECEHFLHCIQTGHTCESSGREGLKVLQILDAADRSLAERSALVDLEPLAAVETAPRKKVVG